MLARRRRMEGGLSATAVRAVVAGILLVAGCTGDTRSSDTRRRDREPGGDTTSLVTPLRGDSLIGAARGVGGEATLRTACAACHPRVHDAPLGAPPAPPALEACSACHETVHEPIQAFYAGAVRGTTVPPDTMFVARVACGDCHTDTTFAVTAGAPRMAALDAACTSCHGVRFSGMVARWRHGTEWRARAVAAYVGSAAADTRLRGDAAFVRVRTARDAMTLVRDAGALHNVLGADRLFRAALDSTASAYRSAGVTAPARPALGPDPASVGCLGCHYGVEEARSTVFGETFDHASHIVRSDIACTECHSDATYFAAAGTAGSEADRDVDPQHGRTTITANACGSCHHTASRSATACTSCHQPGEIAGRLSVPVAMRIAPSATKQRQLPFRHEQHGATRCESCHTPSASMAVTASCTSCHSEHHQPRSDCSQCHAPAKPAHTRQAHIGCVGCHEAAKVASLQPTRQVCLSCHADLVRHNPGRECAQCHQVVWRPGAPAVRSE